MALGLKEVIGMDKKSLVTNRAHMLQNILTPLDRFFSKSKWAERFGDPDICDFTIGNPHDMPLDALVNTLKHWITPRDKYWFAYKRNERKAQEVVSESLRDSHSMPFEPEDIFMTNGATAALAVVFDAIIEQGDEVIFISPPWFLYEAMIANAGGAPVRVQVDMKSFDLDLDAIAGAINERTRAIIINSPQNPTGRVYGADVLEPLAELLTEASEKHGKTIYLISDEAYRRIVFDGKPYLSPAAFYPESFVVYTYGKTLLTPGERIGYIAIQHRISDREHFREVIPILQMVKGWSFPNALLQHSIADLEKICVNADQLQTKRDRLIPIFRKMGYETTVPEGTFYILVRSPIPDDEAFIDILTDYGIFCIPGTLMELPGYFRISLTASDEMIDRSLSGFSAAMERATGRQAAS
jgi:aspartate aminotransferase